MYVKNCVLFKKKTQSLNEVQKFSSCWNNPKWKVHFMSFYGQCL